MSIEATMKAALDILQKKGLNAQGVTSEAVIREDNVTVDPRTGTITSGPDGKLDPNPDKFVGEEAGEYEITIYSTDMSTELLVLSEVGVKNLGLTSAEQIVNHVLSQLADS